jgi:glycosyltransferase involved in cell wall biosynthesis
LLSDTVGLPWAARGRKLTYFPSYPPGATFPLARAAVTQHDATYWKLTGAASVQSDLYFRRLFERTFKAAAVIVTVSESSAADLGELTQRPIRIVSNVVTIDDVTPVPLSNPKPYFLAVGSIEPRKNLRGLAAAFDRSGLANQFDLLLIGRQAWGELPDGIRYLGPVEDPALRGAYEGATALFAASFYEGWGLPIAEALAVGTPVYCSDIPPFKESSQGSASAFFDPHSLDAMVDAFRAAAEPAPRPTPVNNYRPERQQAEFAAVLEEFAR